MGKEQLNQYLDTHQEELIHALQTLVQIPSYKQPEQPGMPYGEGPARALSRALELAQELGFSVKNFDNYVGTATLGTNESLGILCHLDVVPEGSGWHYPPYGGVVENGRLIGRGSIDNKGPAVAVLYAMKAVKECGIPLKHGVQCILGCDEECGSHDLLYYKTKEDFPPMVFTPDGSYPVINIEKGQIQGFFEASYMQEEALPRLISVSGGETINAVPALADALVQGFTPEELQSFLQKADSEVLFTLEKADNGIWIHACGSGAHASTPQLGKNGLTALLGFLSSLPFAESDSIHLIRQLNSLLLYGDSCGKNIGIASEDAKSGALTLAFSIFSCQDGKINGAFDIRFPLCETKEHLIHILMQQLDSAGFCLVKTNANDPHETDENSPFVQTLLRIFTEQTGMPGKCLAIGGGTYVHHIEGGVAFGAEFEGDENNMHGADEYITIDRLMQNAKIFAHAIADICGEE